MRLAKKWHTDVFGDFNNQAFTGWYLALEAWYFWSKQKRGVVGFLQDINAILLLLIYYLTGLRLGSR